MKLRETASRLFPLLIFLGFILAATLIYYRRLYSLPHADDYAWFRYQEIATSSTWDYFIQMLSATRTVGLDYMLFRPVFSGLVSLLDILFRDNRWVIGFFSIFLHGSLGYFLFSFLRKRIGIPLAICFSAIFLTQYLGSAVILWRHVSPYILALLLPLLLFELLEREGFQSKCALVLLMFFSLMVHEVLVVVAVLTGAAAFIVSCLNRSARLRPREVVYLFLVPVAIYAALSVWSLFTYLPADFNQHMTDHAQKLSSVAAIAKTTATFNWYLVPFLFPLELRLILVEAGMPVGMATTPTLMTSWWGPFGFVLCLMGLVLAFVFHLRKGSIQSLHGLYLTVSIVVLLGALAVGRGVQQSKYLSYATYYFYLLNTWFLLLAGLFLASFKKRISEAKTWKTLVFAFSLGALCLAQFNNSRLQELFNLGDRRPQEIGAERTVTTVRRLSKYFSEHPDQCFAGWFGREIFDSAPITTLFLLHPLLEFKSCSFRDNKPVYLTRRDGKFAFVEVVLPKGEEIERPSLPIMDVDPAEIQLKIENPSNGRLRFGKTGKRSYFELVWEHSGVEVRQYKAGIRQELLAQMPVYALERFRYPNQGLLELHLLKKQDSLQVMIGKEVWVEYYLSGSIKGGIEEIWAGPLQKGEKLLGVEMVRQPLGSIERLVAEVSLPELEGFDRRTRVPPPTFPSPTPQTSRNI